MARALKLYNNARAPNPRRLRIFAAENGIELSLEEVDILAGQSRTPEFLAKNSSGAVPVLELDGKPLEEGAQRLGLVLVGPLLEGSLQETEYRRVFEAMAQEHADALLVGPDAENFVNRQLIVGLAEKYRLPTIYPWREYVENGGLMAYAIDLVDLFTRAAGYIDRILKGEPPRDIPIYLAVKFELVVNVKAANAIGLTIPPELLARADEVIE